MQLINSFLVPDIPNGLLALIVLGTLTFFLMFGSRVRRQRRLLRGATQGLRERGDTARRAAPAQLNELFGGPIQHIWKEYSDTLHSMPVVVDGNGAAVVEYRSTIPAEMMFTKEGLVDGPMFDDFFRHLPGILTGLGIIATFAGLLGGLSGFNPSDPQKAIEGLAPLIAGVQHAFTVSAIAIACAMLVVFYSRLRISQLYGAVDNLCAAIDALYESGASEEYLQRLVLSSEKSEAHSGQLKDALVDELRTLLTNLTERQINAQMQAASQIGQSVSQEIGKALGDPMDKIRQAVEASTSGNATQVSTMLETMLTGFMAKLEDTFGGQISGINEQMQKSMAAMASVQAALQTLVQDIQKTNENATAQMSGQLEEAMRRAAENQQQMNQQMMQFVQDFRALLADEQRKSKDTMEQTVAGLVGEVQRAIGAMEEARQSAAQSDRQRHQELSEQTGQLVSGLSANVDELLRSVSEQVTKTQQNIDAVSNVSLRAIEGMNQGALTMGSAAQRFETAGQGVTRALDGSSAFIEQVKAAANALQAASLAVNSGFEKYDATRRTVDSQVAALTGLIDSAKKEAGVSRELVDHVDRSVKALREAEAQSRQHLEAVNDHLQAAFETFGNSLVAQVQRTVGETDKNIAVLSNQLGGVVQGLVTFMQRARKA